MTISPYVVNVVSKIIQIPAVSFFQTCAFQQKPVTSSDQKYSRISLKVFFFISFFKEFYHLEKLQILCSLTIFCLATLQIFSQDYSKAALVIFTIFLQSGSCRCLLIFFRCKLLQKTFSSRVCEVFLSMFEKKKSQYRSRFRGAS